MQLRMTISEIERLIGAAFGPAQQWFHIEDLQPGFLRTRLLFQKWMLRPGDVISGPALFNAADLAMYALILGHQGPALMAATADLSIRFLNRGQPGDIIAEATLLKLGKRLAVIEVRLACGDDPTPVAHVMGSYSIPAQARVAQVACDA
jgi:uncharacterized protein (TIGR00369 family)